MSVFFNVRYMRFLSGSTTRTFQHISLPHPAKKKDPYLALDTGPNLESFCRVLQLYIGIMIGPNYTINVAGQCNKECGICQLFDCAFNNFSNLHVRDLDILLLQDGRPERQLQQTIKCKESGNTSPVYCLRLPKTCGCERRNMVVREVGNLSRHQDQCIEFEMTTDMNKSLLVSYFDNEAAFLLNTKYFYRIKDSTNRVGFLQNLLFSIAGDQSGS